MREKWLPGYVTIQIEKQYPVCNAGRCLAGGEHMIRQVGCIRARTRGIDNVESVRDARQICRENPENRQIKERDSPGLPVQHCHLRKRNLILRQPVVVYDKRMRVGQCAQIKIGRGTVPDAEYER